MKKIFISLLSITLTLLITVKFSGFNYKDNVFAEWSPTWPVMNSDLFYNFLTWKKSSIKDYDPIFILLQSLNQKQIITYDTFIYTYLQDFNWDWLPDIWSIKTWSYWNQASNITDYVTYYSILINKWNMDYDPFYRCVYYKWYKSNEPKEWYYWDCAK